MYTELVGFEAKRTGGQGVSRLNVTHGRCAKGRVSHRNMLRSQNPLQHDTRASQVAASSSKGRRSCAITASTAPLSSFEILRVQSMRELTHFVDVITGLCGNHSPTENAWEVRHWSNGKLTSLPWAGQQHACCELFSPWK